MTRITCTAALSLLLGAGCTATETGNPVAEQRLALTSISSAPEVQLAPDGSDSSDGDGEVLIDEAWVVLGDIRFVPGDDCASEGAGVGQLDIPGPTIIDLIADPQPLVFALQDSNYCRVRLPLERADAVPDGAPAELEDQAVVLRGALADGTPLLVRSRDKRDAELRARSEPFRLGEAEASLLIAFDIGRWLGGIDLQAAELDDGGRIVVDEDNNRELLDVFEDNLKDSLELFRDLDDDGELDDDDRSASLASGG